MTIDEAIELTKNEKACVLKADTCDRDCAKCELLRKTEDVLSAYDMAIKSLEMQEKLEKVVTNGDVIKSMFIGVEIEGIRGSIDKDKLLGYRTWLGGRSQDFLIDWWNAPYTGGGDE